MNEIIMDVLMIVVMVAATVITRYVLPFLKNKVVETNNEILITTIDSAVMYAEQVLNAQGQGKEKKQMVLNYLSNTLSDMKLKITPDQLDVLIEASVYAMNQSKEG